VYQLPGGGAGRWGGSGWRRDLDKPSPVPQGSHLGSEAWFLRTMVGTSHWGLLPHISNYRVPSGGLWSPREALTQA
jgi:hypothetical protein